MNIFEYATKNKLRFNCSLGKLNVEQLWDLPLTSTRQPSLDEIARGVSKQLKSKEEESFVETSTDPEREPLEVSLEILKSIIASKQAANKHALEERDKRAMKQTLLAAKEEKKIDKIKGMSEEEIDKELAKL